MVGRCFVLRITVTMAASMPSAAAVSSACSVVVAKHTISFAWPEYTADWQANTHSIEATLHFRTTQLTAKFTCTMERCRRKHAARKDASLAEAECKMFAKIWAKIESKFVNIEVNEKPATIRTISMNSAADTTPLVLVHGMGAGVGFWAMNVEALARKRPVYAFDLLGFGRSSRPKFSSDATEAENQFVDSIESWRKEMGLNKFILLGHSLGGYLSSAYTVKHPERVQHLILADPWGYQDPETAEPREYPAWVKVIAKAAGSMNPFAALRAAGPLGLRAVKRFRSDLLWKFSSVANEEDVAAYIFYSNSQTPSGEAGFKSMNVDLGWAKNPMIRRVPEIPQETPITMLHGSESWIDSSVANDVKVIHKNTSVQILDHAGHHIYADRAALFNETVNRICARHDLKDSASNSNAEYESLADDAVEKQAMEMDRPKKGYLNNKVSHRYKKSPSTPNFSNRQFSRSEESLNRI